jgi:hypothetical protein
MTIRLRKPVRLLEWGTGTNTTNQKWEQCGEGKIQSCKRKDGVTTMVVEMAWPRTLKSGESSRIAGAKWPWDS